jgi:hypothetical protein
MKLLWAIDYKTGHYDFLNLLPETRVLYCPILAYRYVNSRRAIYKVTCYIGLYPIYLSMHDEQSIVLGKIYMDSLENTVHNVISVIYTI